MGGGKELRGLLAQMEPCLDECDYAFCSVTEDLTSVAEFRPVGTFREEEGLTVILDRRTADALGWPYNSIWKMITLTVHSDLEAVGFMAAVTGALAASGIPANAVAGFYHDHLFVPAGQAHLALETLRLLSAETGERS